MKRVDFVVSNADGFRFERRLTRWRPTPFQSDFGLRPGTYTVHATTREGHATAREIRVGKGPRKFPVRLR